MVGDGDKRDENDMRRTLEIKECPLRIAQDFIDFARTKWHGKQWVALKDLLQLAEQRGKVFELEQRISALENVVEQHENVLSRVKISVEPEKEEEPKKEELAKLPKTLGGGLRG